MNRPDIFQLHAALCQTLANATRLKVIALLGGGEKSVGEMADTIGVSLSNVSQHLAVLRSQDIVNSRKEAQTVFYDLTDRRILEACSKIRAVLLDQMKMRGEVAQETDPKYVITVD